MTVHAKPDRHTYTAIKWEPYIGETVIDRLVIKGVNKNYEKSSFQENDRAHKN